MKQNQRFRENEENEHAQEQHTKREPGHEFASVEELLQYDARQTVVPPRVGENLQKSIAAEPRLPARSWWRRLIKRGEM
jgi:hypothetical protein